MTKPSIFRAAYASVRRPTLLLVLLFMGIVASACYPTHLRSYPILPAGSATPTEVRVTEDYGRYVPTVLQIAVPIVLGVRIGMAQLLYVGIPTTVATQGAKFLLNNVTVNGVRLGQRPRGGGCNMPSGYSSMSSCAVYFLGRRYSIWLGLLLSIIMAMTMYSRVMLNAHTISAVITGALIGFLGGLVYLATRSLVTASCGFHRHQVKVENGEKVKPGRGTSRCRSVHPLDGREPSMSVGSAKLRRLQSVFVRSGGAVGHAESIYGLAHGIAQAALKNTSRLNGLAHPLIIEWE